MNVTNKGKTGAITGFAVASFLLLCALPAFIQGQPLTALFLISLAALLFVAGAERLSLISCARTFKTLLENPDNRSIDSLAAATASSPNAVKKALNKMIKTKVAQGAAIDEQANAIVIEGASAAPSVSLEGFPPPQGAPVAPQANESADQTERTCPGCGAANPHGATTCEHCGSTLS